MSTKGEKCEQALSPKSRVLKKARSFRDDIRSKITRRSSGGSNSSSVPSSPRPVGKSPRHRRRATHSREGSVVDGAPSELHPATSTDIERLQQKSHKVFQSLHYVQDAVDKGILELLPGSITVVLETVMELNQLLGNYFIDQDSTVMLSMNKHVYQRLAHLIRWADDMLLHNKSEIDKTTATDVIKAVTEGIQNLVRLSADKLQKRDSHAKPDNIRTSIPDMPHRSSLPDIPLTPREKEILKQTSSIAASNTSPSSEDVLDNGDASSFNSDDPPPKPPRPDHLHSLLASARLQEDPGVPPPLPAKQRTSNLFVFDDRNHSDLSGQSTPTNMPSPNHSALTGTINDVSDSSSPVSADTVPSAGRLHVGNDRKTAADSRVSYYDNFNAVSAREGSAGIHDLTARIKKLTSNIDLQGCGSSSHAGVDCDAPDVLLPPPLPTKRTTRNQDITLRNRVTSKYENMNDNTTVAAVSRHAIAKSRHTVSGVMTSGAATTSGVTSGVVTSAATGVMRSSRSLTSPGFRTVTLSSSCTTTMQVTLSKETFSSSDTFSSMGTDMFGGSSAESLPKAPPLPPKKRHVEAYMQMLGHYMGPGSLQEFSRHSVHSVNFYHSQWRRHQTEMFQPIHATRSNTMSVLSDFSNHSSDVYSTASGSSSDDSQMALMSSWNPLRLKGLSMTSAIEAASSNRMSVYDNAGHLESSDNDHNEDSPALVSAPVTPVTPVTPAFVANGSPPPCDIQNDSDSDFAEMSTLDDIDVSEQLVRKRPDEDGPEIRGGSTDALIVHATTAGKPDFMFQEAFLTTYRTFITPRLLLQKLLYRYNRFSRINEAVKKKLSRNAFSFIIRMLDELCTELDEGILRTVMELVFQLLCDGELMLARVLRNKVLEKCECRRHLQQASHNVILLPSYQLTVKSHRLMDFKSEQIAEQMTLLDAELFHKIDIPEVLLWSKEQSEEYSPNLAKFTEHFNKMSYWCRSRILEQEDPRERERYFIKLIKVMKHLRKFNNFNSYLAILSAVDSAPIRRLEWQKQNIEVLREFCQLIDSSSSFRAYRQALAETEAPCIPYIGLVLQDLTFVHIGNPDFLSDDFVNFAKRWQQFHILDNMRRFKNGNYVFKKNEKIIAYFNNFDDYLCEESLWQISEAIKPRGRHPKKQHDS